MTQPDIVFSCDEETYYDTFNEMLDVLRENVEGSLVGLFYWEGQRVQNQASHFFSFPQMLEDMQSQAWDEAGEYAEDFGTFATLEDQAECKRIIEDALNRLLPVNFWVVKHPVRKTIERGDVECICPSCNGSGEGQHEGTTCSSCGGSGTGEL